MDITIICITLASHLKHNIPMETLAEQITEVNKTKRSDIFFIDPSLLRIEPDFNTRIDYGDIDELKRSIIENGVRVPLRGYKDGDNYFITDGHRRFKAVSLAIEDGADIARVPFISEKKKSVEERCFDILLLNDGKALTPLELGDTYRRLQSYGYSFTEIANRIGKTVRHVSDMIGVASSSKDVKDFIREGYISATLVADIKSKVKDQTKAEDIIKTARGNNPGVKVTKKNVADLLPEEKIKTFTLEKVRELLTEQIAACAAAVPDDIKEDVFATSLVI